jgi:hypothetical protein
MPASKLSLKKRLATLLLQSKKAVGKAKKKKG